MSGGKIMHKGNQEIPVKIKRDQGGKQRKHPLNC